MCACMYVKCLCCVCLFAVGRRRHTHHSIYSILALIQQKINTIYGSSGRRAQAARTPQQWYQNSWPVFSRSTAWYSDYLLYWYKSTNTEFPAVARASATIFLFLSGARGGRKGKVNEPPSAASSLVSTSCPREMSLFRLGLGRAVGTRKMGGGAGEMERESSVKWK